jgi:hypothetical protein
MLRNMSPGRTLTPGYVVIYPNRDKAASKATKAIVALILIVSVALMLVVTIGGWSKLQGMKPINFAWCIAYLILAFYVFARWSRGVLPMAAALGILLLILSLIAGLGVTGTSWFDRTNAGFGAAQSLFGGTGLSPDTLGLVTLLLAPVQLLLIIFSMQGFAQAWNVEMEVPEDEARGRGHAPPSKPSSPKPAAA